MGNEVLMAQAALDPGLNNQAEIWTPNGPIKRGDLQLTKLHIPSEGKVSIVTYRALNRTITTKRPGSIDFPNIEIECAVGCGEGLQLLWQRTVTFVKGATGGPDALRSLRQSAPPRPFRFMWRAVTSDSGRPLVDYKIREGWICEARPNQLQGSETPEPWNYTYEIAFEELEAVHLYIPGETLTA